MNKSTSSEPIGQETLKAIIPDEFAGQRFDKAMASLFPQFSRSTLQNWLKIGYVHLNGKIAKQREAVTGGELVEVAVPDAPTSDWIPQPLSVDIVYEDNDIIVINKPPGLVVHPGAGNPDNTLVNALLHYDDALSALPRGGIVHRIDKDTSGLLVVARNEMARLALIEALGQHSVERKYWAVVTGVMIAGGTVDEAIGRHPRDRRRMAVVHGGKRAVTHYGVAEKYRAHTLIRVSLETGRTHQIRVHMMHKGFALVGDGVYGGRLKIPTNASDELQNCLRNFKRQALHAGSLSLTQPRTGETLKWQQPIPGDMQQLIDQLKQDYQHNT